MQNSDNQQAADFDAILARTTDHPAARAITDALGKVSIAVLTTDDGKVAGREYVLHVRTADHAAAAMIAAKLFAIRRKFNSFGKVEPLPEMPSSGGIDLTHFPGS